MGIIYAKTLDLKQTKPLTERQFTNSKLNEREALSGEAVLKSYPRRLVLEMTNACNINCKMCGRNSAEFKPTVFDINWLDIFKPIVECIEEITLLGWGEPTLHPQFNEFLRYADSNGLRKFFCTNGMRLNKLKDDIFNYNVDLITVSLDGADQETNNRIRRGSDFNKIIKDVKSIVKERNRKGIFYPYISFVMTMMQSNFRQLPDYVRLANECGIEEIKGVYLTVFDDGSEGELMTNMQDELKEVFDETVELADKFGIVVKLPHLQGMDIAGDKPHKDCFVGWRDFFLGSDGFVRSCMSTPVKLFSLDKYKTFDEMWNSKEYVTFRQSVNNNIKMCSACRNCYQASTANWNKESSFDQRGNIFSPKWE